MWSRTPDDQISHAPADRMEQKNKLCTVGTLVVVYKQPLIKNGYMVDQSEHEAGKTSRAKNE